MRLRESRLCQTRATEDNLKAWFRTIRQPSQGNYPTRDKPGSMVEGEE